MPVEQPRPGIAQAGIQLRPTAAGVAVVAMVIVAGFLSSSTRIAVGFFIPVAIAMVIDAIASRQIIVERQVSIAALRTAVQTPRGINLLVQATPANHPLRLRLSAPFAIEQEATLLDESVTVELLAKHTSATNHVRCEAMATILGLFAARRWETHSVPLLHWSPAPGPAELMIPETRDEVARLRTYVPGDRLSRVSWPVTARTGELHVRAAGVGHEETVVVVNLGPAAEGGTTTRPASDAERAKGIAGLEHVLRLASTAVSQLLEDGHEVRLVTNEVGPGFFNDMRSRALADPREPGRPPVSSSSQTSAIADVVTDEDDLTRRLALAEVGPPITWPEGPFLEISPSGIGSFT